MTARRQVEKSAIEIKTRLLLLGLSIADLGRSLKPQRPRSTVSQAIHHRRFPKVRKQIEQKLWP